MSWLYSQALVAAYSHPGDLDGIPCVLSNGTPTPLAYCAPDRMTDFSKLSRYGATFKPLTEENGEALLTLYLAAFHARTSVPQAKAQASRASDQECGGTLPGLLAKYDPATHSLKTAQCSLFEDSTECYLTLPRSGLMQGGSVYQRPESGHCISATESGLLPTPTVSSGAQTKENPTPGQTGGTTLPGWVKQNQWATPTTMDKLPPKSAEALHREATVARPGRSKPANLRDQVSNMQNWPTPAANDDRDGGNKSTPAIKRRIEKGKQVMLSMSVSEDSGALNPDWVEKLMLWPKGWSQLQPMDEIEYLLWSINYAECETTAAERLQSLWCEIGEEAIREAVRGLHDIQESEPLLAILREYKAGKDNVFWILASSKEIQKEILRVLPIIGEPGYPPHRPETIEQQAKQLTDALQALSRFVAQYGQEATQDGSWENAVPRVGKGIEARAHQLHCIGNGQVPQCAAYAWQILSNEAE